MILKSGEGPLLDFFLLLNGLVHFGLRVLPRVHKTYVETDGLVH